MKYKVGDRVIWRKGVSSHKPEENGFNEYYAITGMVGKIGENGLREEVYALRQCGTSHDVKLTEDELDNNEYISVEEQ